MSLKCNSLMLFGFVFVRHILLNHYTIWLNFFINNFVASLYKSKPETIKKHIDFLIKNRLNPKFAGLLNKKRHQKVIFSDGEIFFDV